MIALVLVLAAVVGALLVVLGAGGSVVTVPVLIYAGGLEPARAAATSLVVVGLVAALGVAMQRRAVDLRAGLVLGALGMVGTVPGVWLSHQVPGVLVRLGFALVLLAAGVAMARDDGPAPPRARPRGAGIALAAGLGVGVASGFFGVGGGFLIVPALTLLVGLDVAHAIPTSLFVIALNSLAGVAGHVAYGAVDWRMGGLFALAAFAGAGVVSPLARRVSQVAVRRAFAAACVVLAVAIAAESLCALAA